MAIRHFHPRCLDEIHSKKFLFLETNKLNSQLVLQFYTSCFSHQDQYLSFSEQTWIMFFGCRYGSSTPSSRHEKLTLLTFFVTSSPLMILLFLKFLGRVSLNLIEFRSLSERHVVIVFRLEEIYSQPAKIRLEHSLGLQLGMMTQLLIVW